MVHIVTARPQRVKWSAIDESLRNIVVDCEGRHAVFSSSLLSPTSYSPKHPCY
jgi:hypothetical protein